MFKTKAAHEKRKQTWCPMGRVSVQNVEGARVQALQAGAFNIVNFGQGKPSGADAPIYLACTCVGPHCPLYRPGILPWRWGRCALAQPADGPWIFAAFIALGGIAAATLTFFLAGGA